METRGRTRALEHTRRLDSTSRARRDGEREPEAEGREREEMCKARPRPLRARHACKRRPRGRLARGEARRGGAPASPRLCALELASHIHIHTQILVECRRRLRTLVYTTVCPRCSRSPGLELFLAFLSATYKQSVAHSAFLMEMEFNANESNCQQICFSEKLKLSHVVYE